MRRGHDKRFGAHGIFHEVDHGVGGDAFVQVVVDEGDGRGAAGGEAFDELDAELSVTGRWRRDTEAVVMVVRIEADGLGELFLHLVAARERTCESSADSDDGFARRIAAKPGIESDKLS